MAQQEIASPEIKSVSAVTLGWIHPIEEQISAIGVNFLRQGMLYEPCDILLLNGDEQTMEKYCQLIDSVYNSCFDQKVYNDHDFPSEESNIPRALLITIDQNASFTEAGNGAIKTGTAIIFSTHQTANDTTYIRVREKVIERINAILVNDRDYGNSIPYILFKNNYDNNFS